MQALRRVSGTLQQAQERWRELRRLKVAGATRDAGRPCQRLLVVENLETFRALEAYAWIDRRGLDVLGIYRGDMELPNKDPRR